MYTNTEIQIFHIALLTREEVGIVLEKRSTRDTLVSVLSLLLTKNSTL